MRKEKGEREKKESIQEEKDFRADSVCCIDPPFSSSLVSRLIDCMELLKEIENDCVVYDTLWYISVSSRGECSAMKMKWN